MGAGQQTARKLLQSNEVQMTRRNFLKLTSLFSVSVLAGGICCTSQSPTSESLIAKVVVPVKNFQPGKKLTPDGRILVQGLGIRKLGNKSSLFEGAVFLQEAEQDVSFNMPINNIQYFLISQTLQYRVLFKGFEGNGDLENMSAVFEVSKESLINYGIFGEGEVLFSGVNGTSIRLDEIRGTFLTGNFVEDVPRASFIVTAADGNIQKVVLEQYSDSILTLGNDIYRLNNGSMTAKFSEVNIYRLLPI